MAKILLSTIFAFFCGYAWSTHHHVAAVLMGIPAALLLIDYLLFD